MFEVGFTELLLIFALALIVLGPHRLPELASKIGRWVGRARAMARQLREQLDQEVSFEDAAPRPRRATPETSASTPTPGRQDVDAPNDPPPDVQTPHERPGP